MGSRCGGCQTVTKPPKHRFYTSLHKHVNAQASLLAHHHLLRQRETSSLWGTRHFEEKPPETVMERPNPSRVLPFCPLSCSFRGPMQYASRWSSFGAESHHLHPISCNPPISSAQAEGKFHSGCPTWFRREGSTRTSWPGSCSERSQCVCLKPEECGTGACCRLGLSHKPPPISTSGADSAEKPHCPPKLGNSPCLGFPAQGLRWHAMVALLRSNTPRPTRAAGGRRSTRVGRRPTGAPPRGKLKHHHYRSQHTLQEQHLTPRIT